VSRAFVKSVASELPFTTVKAPRPGSVVKVELTFLRVVVLHGSATQMEIAKLDFVQSLFKPTPSYNLDYVSVSVTVKETEYGVDLTKAGLLVYTLS
jgi:hypothetical protein